MKRAKGNPSPIERIARLAPVTESGCWLWIGYKGPDGYGRFKYRGAMRSAHRVSYELHVGQVPTGFEVDHLCRVRACVNPDHLEAVTREENVRRQKASHTHCRKGHEYTVENTRMRGGKRACRTCDRSASAAYRRRKRLGSAA